MAKKANKKDGARPKLHMKKGDRVEVISGDWKGAKGVVKVVDTRNCRVTVEGVNLVTRHTRRRAQHLQGGTIEVEAPVHVSNVRLLQRG